MGELVIEEYSFRIIIKDVILLFFIRVYRLYYARGGTVVLILEGVDTHYTVVQGCAMLRSTRAPPLISFSLMVFTDVF